MPLLSDLSLCEPTYCFFQRKGNPNEISVLKWSGFRQPLRGLLCERAIRLQLYRQVGLKDTHFAVRDLRPPR